METSDEDPYPNFDSAFPSNTSADPGAVAASWHPAFRANSEHTPAGEGEEEDDDFFDRYPGATPKKHAQPPGDPDTRQDDEVAAPDDEETNTSFDAAIRRQSISVSHSISVQGEDATPEMLQRGPSNTVQVEGPGTRSWEEEEEDMEVEDRQVLMAGDTRREQETALAERMPDDDTSNEGDMDAEAPTTPLASEAAGGVMSSPPSAHSYEHQGEITEMEEAQDPSGTAPLMQEEEEGEEDLLPTPGPLSREPTMPSREVGFDGAQREQHEKAPPQLDRSFTTNFSETPVQSQAQEGRSRGGTGAVGVPEEWPSVGDDKVFGELLDEPTPAAEEENSAALERQAASESQYTSAPDIEPPTSLQRAALEKIAEEESRQIVSPDADVLLEEQDDEEEEEDLAAAWGAAIDDDELLEDTPTDADLDPSQFFGGDEDDGFLLEEDEPLAPLQAQQAQQQQRTAPAPTTNQQQYRPQNPQQQQPQQYFPTQQPPTTSFSSSSHSRSANTPSTGLDDNIYNTSQPTSPQFPRNTSQHGFQPQQPRPNLQQTQSFADKAKGGYQSPYDLPMEVVKPRRRAPPPQQRQITGRPPSQQGPGRDPGPGLGMGLTGRGAPAPPMRTSSITSSFPTTTRTTAPAAAAPPRPRTGGSGSGSSLSPPQSSHSGGSAGAVKSTPKTGGSGGGGGFFEDLPMTTKPRAARPAGAGLYSPQLQQGGMGMPTPPVSTPPVGGMMSPPLPQQQQYPPRSSSGSSYAPQQASIPAMYGGGGGGLGLQRPAQLPLLPEQPSLPVQGGNLPAPPAVQNRYSPAPIATAPAPAATSRYSPAPAAQPGPGKARQPSIPPSSFQQTHPFAPRTSSPLAAMQTEKPHPPLPLEATRGGFPEKPHPPLPPEAATRSLPPPPSPPKANGILQQRNLSISPESQPTASRYAPSEASSTISAPPTTFAPPQRPRTQSPDATMKGPRAAAMAASMVRPSSSAGMSSAAALQQQPKRPVLPHKRQFSRDLTFAVPQDERSRDPLERWKGHAIFKWSASGTIVSTFPKQTPFYAAGQGIPSVKCTPGAITVQDASAFMPMEDRNARFPGPLTARSKRQKKDVVAWLNGKTEDLERTAEGAMLDFSMDSALRKRVEEKVLLWKIVRIFVENEGVLEGNSKIEEEVRRVLLPNLAQMAMVADLQSPSSSSPAGMVSEPVDKQVLFQIRQALLEGQRERAVWLAEEKKLWGHAMLIASTMGPETWKQIIQTFVRSQVKGVGSDARSTAALYQVFAGNAEDCVDELVPPSARAGFQMISSADGKLAGNPLEGLDQWRETLGLITSNRTPSDGQSLLALGKLLAGYGRVEAAHVCFLFARQLAKHSGADEGENVDYVLLGANHLSQDEVLGNDLDSILLTEVYEYASSLSAPSKAVEYIPHLQAFKLVHAQELAAYGLKTQAQTYCEHIISAYSSTTRPSPYYHPAFTQAVADFGAFLSQTPHDGKSGSFFSKPAMKTVSSGAASWFTKFVAGEDDRESNGSGPGGAGSDDMAGPFGRVNGESPSISRTASVTDLYNPAMGGVPIPGMVPTQQTFAPSSAPSRYAPSSHLVASKSASALPYGGLGIPSAEPQRPSSSRYAPAPSSSLGVPRPDVARRGSDHSVPSYAPSSRRGSALEDTSSQGSYEPRPILSDEGSGHSYSPAFNSPLVQAQHAPPVQEPGGLEGPNGIAEPLNAEEVGGADAETGGGYEPSTGGYEPPSYGYQPYEPEPGSPEEARPKKKTFGDDDDAEELAKRAAALKKAQADREADDAFRKAAEADAARGKDGAAQKKGWLGGWFGGKKDGTASPGPIKAKLGEENSFYYDKDLKKWVNKKGGAEAAVPVTATPPPPRGPASRVASAAAVMGPPSGPPSRASSGTGANVRPPTSGSGPAFSGPPSGPPSRTGTPASELGAGSQLGVNGDAAGAALAPPMRPGSSLSAASSIDDLLAGPPGARKGGTVKGKKKGRYVDVMAQS